MADTPSAEDTALIEQAIKRAPEVWPAPIASPVIRSLKEHLRVIAFGCLPDPGVELARAILALPVPAPAVDREGLAEQAFQIAYDAVDWNDTIRWVTPGPGEAAWTDVGTLRVQADEIVKQAVDALISAGLVRAVDTAQDGSEHRG